MKNQGINLFIVDDNKLMAKDLKNYLQSKFGAGVNLNISTFDSANDCIEKTDKNTHIVILDFLDDEKGLSVLKSIKLKNPQTEVILFSCKEDIEMAIQTFRAGGNDYIIKGEDSLKNLIKTVTYIITTPIRLMVREFGVSKYMAIFLLTFVGMGAVVFFVSRYTTLLQY